ncbi:hypothetical protein Hanom_Chr03g00269511 [Helianthus anomalus]
MDGINEPDENDNFKPFGSRCGKTNLSTKVAKQANPQGRKWHFTLLYLYWALFRLGQASLPFDVTLLWLLGLGCETVKELCNPSNNYKKQSSNTQFKTKLQNHK